MHRPPAPPSPRQAVTCRPPRPALTSRHLTPPFGRPQLLPATLPWSPARYSLRLWIPMRRCRTPPSALHTPFGQAGQDALNECMQPHGGFEHNLQSLRVVDELEERYADFPGLNLTFECREGILKHCSVRNARDLGELGERFLQRGQPGLE